LIYIQTPYKINNVNSFIPEGTSDYTNENANNLLQTLQINGITVFDLRNIIIKENVDHYSLFYRTDHHWKPEAGLWASWQVSKFLENEYALDMERELLNPILFSTQLISKSFLGSQGMKIGLNFIQPDDFSILYPNYKTQFILLKPSDNLNLNGSFSDVMFDQKKLLNVDIISQNYYGAFLFSGGPLLQIKNIVTKNTNKILIIKDSFANVVIPFLSLVVGEIDVIDLRSFTGSLETFIKEEEPDIVIIMYNPPADYEIRTQENQRNNRFVFD